MSRENNPILDQIGKHASVRAYRPDPVPAEDIDTIVAAGQRTSSSSNLQTYAVIAVTEAATRNTLSHLCGDQDQIRQAPLFLAWCADLSRLDRATVLRGHPHAHNTVESFLIAAVDTAITGQTAALAAESLGYGICYIGSLRNNPAEVITLLGLPRLMFPLFGMTVGVPAHPHRLRPRLPLRAVLHHERYSRAAEDAALAEYDRAMIATGIYEGRQVAVPGKPGVMEDYGWTEHSARRVSRPTRLGLRAVLRDQGFDLE